MQRDLTTGSITGNLLRFAFPMMLGNLLQQFYNIADTWIVGQYLGSRSLAAVGSSYTLMTFLTSVLLGLCMGCGAAFSIYYGRKDTDRLGCSVFQSFVLILLVTAVLNTVVYVFLEPILHLLQVPDEVVPFMKTYLRIIFAGIPATFLYNFCASLLRALGISTVPLLFLGISAVLNIVLDYVFVVIVPCGISGAAGATVFAQYIAGIGILLYTLLSMRCINTGQEHDSGHRSKSADTACPTSVLGFSLDRKHLRYDRTILRDLASLSFLTCMQQSIMNFGILMIQGLVNSFGTVIMAAFAAAVKIDSFAYMPVQDFGNAFSTFVAQNYGANKKKRIRQGIRSVLVCVFIFCAVISTLVYTFAEPLMTLFIDSSEPEIIAAGVHYLHIEGACYLGIGILFLLYGFYRAIQKPGMSVVLTIISLGTRVLLAYLTAPIPAVGVTGIWAAIPIGWVLADLTGGIYYWKVCRKSL